MATEKTCFKCHETKPLTEFYRHPAMGDGHLGKCKACTKADVILNRLSKLSYYRQYDRQRASAPHRVIARQEYQQTPAYNIAARKAKAAWDKANPHKKKAATTVNNRKKRGKIDALPCWTCGDPKAEAHHPDYSMPLDVVWLCRKHHTELHKMARGHF